MIDENKAWEPYSLNVGDVVRIKVNAECEWIITREMLNTKELDPLRGHPRVYNNQLGMIVYIDKTPTHGHYYRVAFLRRLLVSEDELMLGADFALGELELIERTISYSERQIIARTCELLQVDYTPTENN